VFSVNGIDELTKYIAAATGAAPVIEPLPAGVLAALPLYLERRFEIRRMHLFGQPVLIAMADAREKPDLAQLARQREALVEKLGSPVVLVLPQIMSYERKRLIEKRIPFIVPGRQMYLPMFMTDLRETFAAPVRTQAKTISWVAQVIVLRHLLLHDMTECPLSQIAHLFGYTPMAITQAVDELAALRLCERVRLGRVKTIQFQAAPREIWQTALPRMRSPVKKSLLARKLDTGSGRLLHAGMTALADRTNLASTTIETFAVRDSEIRTLLDEGRIETCPLEEDAVAIVEAWSYMPELLTQGPAVDPLSLYLCFTKDPDERVQLALEQLLELLE
jgi:hypothetical protein